MGQFYSFTFPIRAISKDNDKSFDRSSGHFFKARKFRKFEEAIKMYFLAQKPESFKMFECEVKVDLKFYFVIGKTRGDLFNLPKSVCDALNGLVWKDDRMIRYGTLYVKRVPAENEQRIEMSVSPFEGFE